MVQTNDAGGYNHTQQERAKTQSMLKQQFYSYEKRPQSPLQPQMIHHVHKPSIGGP